MYNPCLGAWVFIIIFYLASSSILVESGLISENGSPKVYMVQQRPEYFQISHKLVQNFKYETLNETRFVDVTANYSQDRKNVVLGHAFHRFIFTCKAPYTTRWISTIPPLLPFAYEHSRSFNNSPLAVLYGENDAIYTSKLSIILPPGISGTVLCQGIDNFTSNRRTSVYIYSQSGTSFSQYFTGAVLQTTSDTRYPHLVPITSNYPHIKAMCKAEQASSLQNTTRTLLQAGNFDPALGIIVPGHGSFLEVITCVNKENNETAVCVNQNMALLEKSIKIEFHIIVIGFRYGIFCSSSIHAKQGARMINCDSVDECNNYKFCFARDCSKNDIVIKSHPKVATENTTNTYTIDDPHLRGIVACASVHSYLSLEYNYLFTGLDRKRCHPNWLNSNDAPSHALIQIREMNTILYTNRPHEFVCETINFVLVSNIRFAIQLSNGTTYLVDQPNVQMSDEADEKNFDSTDQLNFPHKANDVVKDTFLGITSKTIKMNLTKEMTQIYCFAPWTNSTGWINTSKKFEARDVMPAKIIKSSSNQHDSKSPSVYFIGDKSRSIICNAIGEPKPHIKWTIPENLKTKFEAKGIATEDEHNLNFPLLDESFRGMWKLTCTASNDYGQDEQDFYVEVTDPKVVGDGLNPIAIAGIVIIILGLCIVLGVFVIKYYRAKKELRNLTPEEIDEFRKGNPECLKTEGANARPHEKIKWMGFDPAYEIPEVNLELLKSSILGEGQYGKVYRGILLGEAVAVKTTKSNADVSYVKALLSELKIMCYIGRHPHIVHFHGAVLTRVHERIVLVVIELSPLGNLEHYLRKVGSGFVNLFKPNDNMCGNGNNDVQKSKQVISTRTLVHWCQQIANGMNYLTSKQVVHADLATRNVLLFKNNIVKITDFGLSRQLYGYAKYTKKQRVPLPWQWMAIESLSYSEFSWESDVWSYGVTVWEIFTFAQVPYPGMSWTLDFVDRITKGMRLKMPEMASPNIYNKLMECWNLEKAARPTFQQLELFFAEIMNSLADLETFTEDASNFTSSHTTQDGPITDNVPKAPTIYTNLASAEANSALPSTYTNTESPIFKQVPSSSVAYLNIESDVNVSGHEMSSFYSNINLESSV